MATRCTSATSIPNRPGLEVFGPHENEGGEYDKWTAGAALYDARTGKILWGTPDGQDVGGGVTGDVDPRYPGEEMWGIPGGLHSCKGEVISARGPAGGGNSSFVIWWDGDPLREVLGGNRISKWDWQNATSRNLLTAQGCAAAAGPSSAAICSATGERNSSSAATDSSALRIYTTTIPTEHRLYTLMHDPQYRLVDRLAERGVQPAAASQLLSRRRHESAAEAEHPAGGAEDNAVERPWRPDLGRIDPTERQGT